MNITPAIAKSVSIVTGDMKSLAGAVLQGGHGVVSTLDQEFDGLGAELCAVEAIEQDRPASPLSVTDLSGEDRFTRVPTPIELEIAVADHGHHLVSQRLGCATQGNVTCWISRFGLRAEFAALFIHDAFTTNDNYILLQIVEMLYALNEVFDIKGVFRHKDDIRTSVGRSECDIAGMPTHHLDDCDSTMALGRCPDPFDATG